MGRHRKKEQLRRMVLLQEEMKVLIQYVYQQWESGKQDQCNPVPHLAYTETLAFECSSAYQNIKNMSVEMMRDMRTYKREKVLAQIEELYQHMLSIVAAVLETIRKYSVSAYRVS
ncbi:hypothetical protein [Bacillus cereus]|uniref:Uncharacterized protein n=1 Tax=Bacillus cereus TaxID=1396 RepID=A0A9X7QNC3_BACCE|nr:hypothetical protein [Bacillus cereus]QDZ77276.1 hypothetical protein D0437_31785 [Bacillus cereus]